MAQELRSEELYKVPGVSETIDWVAALVALDRETLDADAIDDTLGVVLKAKEDLEALRGRRAAELFERAIARSVDARHDDRACPVPDVRLLDNLLIFGRVLRARGLRRAPRASRGARRSARVRQPRRTRRRVSHVPRAARPSPRPDRDLRSGVCGLLAGAPRRQTPDSARAGRTSAEPRATVVQIEDVLAPEALDAPDAAASTTERRLKVWSDARRSRRQGLRGVHDRTSSPRRAPRSPDSSGSPASVERDDGFADGERASIFDARSPRASAAAATW